MPERSSYPNGVPTWVDVATPDVDGTVAFYCQLFGWEHVVGDNPEETGGYGMFSKDGKLVAGVGPLQSPEQPVVWSTYIAVDDADATAAKAQEAGGQVAVAPMDIFDFGRMAFLVDPTGAFIGIWQAGSMGGAELVGEEGAVGWNELATRDTDAANAFYSAVFGWEPTAWPGGGDIDYTVWTLGEEQIAGLLAMEGTFPPEVPPHWGIYFLVGDADAAAAKAAELGGTVNAEPFDVPDVGRMAALADPSGAAFSVMTPAPPAEE